MSGSAHSPRLPLFRRFWKPALATGGGGTAIAIWFEEIIAIVAEIIGVIFLIILGGLILLFNHFLFKYRLPRQEDLKNTTHEGTKH